MNRDPWQPQLTGPGEIQMFWRRLVRPLGRRQDMLYVVLVDADDRPIPILNEIEHPPPLLEGEAAQGFGSVIRQTIDDLLPGGRVALLYHRPGHGVTDADRETAASYYAVLEAFGIPHETIYLATESRISALPRPGDEPMTA